MTKKINEKEKKLFKAIGARIRQLRTKKKMTQNQLGEQIGLEQSSLGKIETGRTQPTIVTIFRIAELFDVSPVWLLTGEHSAVDLSAFGIHAAIFQEMIENMKKYPALLNAMFAHYYSEKELKKIDEIIKDQAGHQ